MAVVLKKLYHGYKWLFYEIADPRSADFLVSSPLVLAGLITLYVYTVRALGPQWMRNRKPFNIKILLMIYNLVQILANVYLMYQISYTYKKIGSSCIPVDYSESSQALFELGMVRIFFWLKMFDWVDTIFFVLRKSNRQITFLHVYHHAGMVLVAWTALKYIGGGHSLFVGSFNFPIHGVMFAYYLITTIDDKWKQNISMKKVLTQLQMIQFLSFIIIYGRILFDSSCPFPRIVCYIFVIQNIFMLTLFGDFYRKAYLKKQKRTEELKQH